MPELLALKVFFFLSFYFFLLVLWGTLGGKLLSLYTAVHQSVEKNLQET